MLQAMTYDQFFDMDRIMEPEMAPEIFAHRVANIEVLPGECLRLWHVVDVPSCGGHLSRSRVVAKMIYPLSTFMPARTFTTMWFMRNGLFRPEPKIVMPPRLH